MRRRRRRRSRWRGKRNRGEYESVLMRGIFKVGKKSHDVLLTRIKLTWTPIIPESPTGDGTVLEAGAVLLQDVFAVKVKRRRAATQQSGGAVLGLALFHCRRRGRRLEEDTLHLHNASAEHTHSWYNTLKELLSGSTDVVSCSVHGVRDPVTAALHIVLGHLQQVDMCSFSSNGQLVRFGFSAMFGFGGRSLARAEKKRWMPSSRRREYALVKTLMEESWITNQGLYLSISIMSIPCLSPHDVSASDVGNASRSEFIKHLKRYSSSSGQFSFPFVETHSVSEVKIRPRSLIGWSEEDSEEEGDSKTTPIIQSEVHPRLITLYGEEVDEAESSITCNCI
uniref:Ceramide kinase-like n=1 Tax=Cyprinodon variegatus TaxID=28743 RepID=A0A3Q2CQX5_CYPVA